MATELKHAPDKDVMELLGWTDLRRVKSAYQHADAETMLVTLQTRGRAARGPLTVDANRHTNVHTPPERGPALNRLSHCCIGSKSGRGDRI